MKMKDLDHTYSVQLLRLQYMEQAPQTSNTESQNNLCPWNPEDYSKLERHMHVSLHCNCPSRAQHRRKQKQSESVMSDSL